MKGHAFDKKKYCNTCCNARISFRMAFQSVSKIIWTSIKCVLNHKLFHKILQVVN